MTINLEIDDRGIEEVVAESFNHALKFSDYMDIYYDFYTPNHEKPLKYDKPQREQSLLASDLEKQLLLDATDNKISLSQKIEKPTILNFLN